jgi:hypothetical protein
LAMADGGGHLADIRRASHYRYTSYFLDSTRATATYRHIFIASKMRRTCIYTYATHAFSIALLHPHCLLDGRTRFVSSCPSCLFRGGFAYPLTLLQIRAVFCI